MNKADQEIVEQATPFMVPLLAFIVWLRRPDWSAEVCQKKATEFWRLIE